MLVLLHQAQLWAHQQLKIQAQKQNLNSQDSSSAIEDALREAATAAQTAEKPPQKPIMQPPEAPKAVVTPPVA